MTLNNLVAFNHLCITTLRPWLVTAHLSVFDSHLLNLPFE